MKTMEKVRLIDIAEQLGLSVATVSNVLNGKHHKISPKTEQMVLQAIEESGYLPSRAEVLLARNPRSLIGFVVNDHPIYEGRLFEDPFIARTLSALIHHANIHGLDVVIRGARLWEEIAEFASTWNMKGLVLTGFCKTDYEPLRRRLRIPMVVYGGGTDGYASVYNDDLEGGKMMGKHLLARGCKKVLCHVFDADEPDSERVKGLQEEGLETYRQIVPPAKKDRLKLYDKIHFDEYPAVFCTSDLLALELIRYLKTRNINVPQDLLVCGFDGIQAGEFCSPSLTTIAQNYNEQAEAALDAILKNGHGCLSKPILVERESTFRD
ncbi:LacI family DNA-binding transcriptional regulator [Erysipelotrichaceae bacterium RD49]|nr:LacI family DNA-binding transcriptional regulator [Erysipelotrichaceae bacterium RD49]